MSNDSITVRAERPTALRTRLMWGGRAISALLGLLLMMSAVMKLMGGTEVVEGFARMGLPASLRVPLGILEFLCVVLYLIPVTSVTGAILLTGYIGGAIVTHLRLGEPVYMQIALGVIIWLGLYFREPRLANLIPLKIGGGFDSGHPSDEGTGSVRKLPGH